MACCGGTYIICCQGVRRRRSPSLSGEFCCGSEDELVDAIAAVAAETGMDCFEDEEMGAEAIAAATVVVVVAEAVVTLEEMAPLLLRAPADNDFDGPGGGGGGSGNGCDAGSMA